jgi:hypothetical protein
MSFTYNPADPDDITRVRWHIQDTVEPAAFTDEEITFQIGEQGGWQKAVMACLQSKIMLIANTPDFKADWLQVDSAVALDSLRGLLKVKQKELGLGGAISSRGQAVYRGDSLLTDVPDGW